MVRVDAAGAGAELVHVGLAGEDGPAGAQLRDARRVGLAAPRRAQPTRPARGRVRQAVDLVLHAHQHAVQRGQRRPCTHTMSCLSCPSRSQLTNESNDCKSSSNQLLLSQPGPRRLLRPACSECASRRYGWKHGAGRRRRRTLGFFAAALRQAVPGGSEASATRPATLSQMPIQRIRRLTFLYASSVLLICGCFASYLLLATGNGGWLVAKPRATDKLVKALPPVVRAKGCLTIFFHPSKKCTGM